MFAPILRSYRLLSRRQKFGLSVLLFARVIVNLFDIAGIAAIGLLGAMLGAGLDGRPEANFFGLSLGTNSQELYFSVILAVALFFLSKSVMSIFLLRQSVLFFARIESAVAGEIAVFLYSGSLTRLRRYSRGDINFAIGSSPTVAMSGLLVSGSTIVTESTLFLSVFGIFLAVDLWTAFAISVYFLSIVLIFQFGINRRLKKIGISLRESSIALGNSIQDMTVSFREISVLAKFPYFLNHFQFHRRKSALDNAVLSVLVGLPRFVIEIALMLGILALIGFQLAQGDITGGLVTAAVFLAGGFRMMTALLPIQSAISNIRAYGPQAELAQDLLVEARAGDGSNSAVERFVSTGKTERAPGFSIRLSDVTFTHSDSNSPAVRGLNLDIKAGDFVALVGPSGAGKTTVADLILGVEAPESGEIVVDGLDPQSLRKRFPGSISYVPQNPGLVSGSIASNIALGQDRNSIDFERVWEALEKVEIADFVRNLPHEIHSDLGKQADGLSGGQKQRLGLARALYTDPHLLVLDEATSALDAVSEANITRIVSNLRPLTTVIVVAHRLSTIQHADTVYVLESGTLSAQGSFREVRRQVPLIETYVNLMRIDPL